MNKFSAMALKATTLSPLMENRTKISVQELISTYPDGVVINGIDMVTSRGRNGEDNTYPIFTFDEDPTRFGFGGAILKQIVEAWIAAYDGDVEITSAALKKEGGCKVKFSHGLTKEGRNITSVEVVA